MLISEGGGPFVETVLQRFSFVLGRPFGKELRLPPGFIPECLPFRLVVITTVFFDD